MTMTLLNIRTDGIESMTRFGNGTKSSAKGNTTMTWWQRFRQRFGRSRPPVIRTMIDGVEMVVTESARRQASANMAADPSLRAKVVDMVGEAEARRRYPEAGWE